MSMVSFFFVLAQAASAADPLPDDEGAMDMDRGAGSLPAEAVADVMKKNNFKVSDCFTKHAFKEQSGRLVVEVEIDLDGSVKGVRKLESSLGNPTFETCVVGAVQTYRFPAPKGDGTALATWPFVFQ